MATRSGHTVTFSWRRGVRPRVVSRGRCWAKTTNLSAYFAGSANLDNDELVKHRGVVAAHAQKARVRHLVPVVDRQILEIGLAPEEFLAVQEAADGVAADLHDRRVDGVGLENPAGFPVP